jgi:alkylation response protein AidB-like acyl-CoA dehydrogenase
LERDEKQIFPHEAIEKLGKLGFMGMMIPEQYGGSGMDTISYVLALEEISKIDASVGAIMSVNNSLVCHLIFNWGTEEQKQHWLISLASGEKLGAFSLSEPQSGSDAANMHSFARQMGNHYILNGIKNWVTNGESSDVVIVFAMTRKGIGYRGISAFLVEKGTPGFKVGKKENKLGIRSSDTTELVFEDCKIPLKNRIGEEGMGFKIAMRTLDGGRIGIAAQALGIAHAALERSAKYALERKQFGRRISEFQAIRFKLAKIATELDAARLLTLRAAYIKDTDKEYTMEAAMAKWKASQVAMEASTQCVQIFGGYGYMQEYGVERLMRDAKITQIYEGTSEIQQMVIGREILRKYEGSL